MFLDRRDAGRKVSHKLAKYSNAPNVIVIGLPRGGVVLAFEVAQFLHQPLDVICPRKIGAPHNQELAIGAITETGNGYFNMPLIEALGVSSEYIDNECATQQAVALRRLSLFRKGLSPLNFKEKIVIIVDDGLATGATMKAAIESVKLQKPLKIIVAVPVSPSDTATEIEQMCDEFVCLHTPSSFQAVGQFYKAFNQTEDTEVCQLLERAKSKIFNKPV